MDDDAPMDLVDDNFDDCSIEDEPLDDGNGSFFNPDAYVEEEDEVEPTSENFRVGNRYKPSHHTPRELPTIREENRDDMRSTAGSRMATRPPSAQSDKSNDISSQFGFQSGGAVIEHYTDNFYSEANRAERLFPESDLVNKGYISPIRDKQNSWEPSVCHYEKQPTPEVQNNSPGLIFANMSSRKENTTLQSQQCRGANRDANNFLDNPNDENVHSGQNISPEKNIFATSPMNSTKFLETKTSTPKRPGGTNRLGQRGLPSFDECSTIYESPQRSISTSRLFQSRHPTNSIITNSMGVATSDTILSNRTISDSMIKKVLGGNKKDHDLLNALEQVRKKRDHQPPKPDFRLNVNQSKLSSKVPMSRPPMNNRLPTTSIQLSSDDGIKELPNTTLSNQLKPQDSKRSSSTASDLTSSNTTSLSSNMSRLSTARTDSIRSSRHRGGFSDSSVSTMIPNSSSTTTLNREQDGRDSVTSMRTISRASSTMTAGGSYAQATGTMKPIKISARKLAFGVVPVNETLTRELEIENISDRPCQVRSQFDSVNPAVQILDNKLTIIDPKKNMKLRVAFTPEGAGRYQLYLSVDVPAQNFSQKIPIWGMGGVANVVPSSKHLHSTKNTSEFALYSPKTKHISFKLNNLKGERDGFALMTVYDSAMRPIPKEFVIYQPGRAVIIGKRDESEIEIRINTTYAHHDDSHRTSSAMSTASSVATTRRRVITGADYVVQVCWGEEILRQRLKILESRTGRRQSIDCHDFTSERFCGEDKIVAAIDTMPSISIEDIDVFASSYRTLYINVFSSLREVSAFRAATSGDDNDVTVLETTAFRHQTFVNDVTLLPKSTTKRS